MFRSWIVNCGAYPLPPPPPPGGGAKALILDGMVLIICFSPLKAKEMDRKVVKNKRLAEMTASSDLEARVRLAGSGGFENLR